MDQVLPIVIDALSQFLQTVLVGVLPILAAAAAAWVVGEVKKVWQESKLAQYVTPEQLQAIATMAVKAAEQLGLNQKIEDKKNYAVEVVQSYLSNVGLKVDLESVLAAVEAAVIAEFPKE